MGMYGYSLQIKNVEDDLDDGDGQLFMSLSASVFLPQEREPVLGGTVHPLRVSFCLN